jgi:hypothetical protein
MGYRSDVTALFYAPKEKGAALKLYVDENFPTIGDLIKDEDLTWFDRDGRCGYLFENQHVKWYDSYAEIQAFDKFVSAFVELADGENAQELQWSFEFVRVGEDYEDIEFKRSEDCDNLLDVRREIQVNY